MLSALQSRLLTPDLVKLFTEEFNRELERLTRARCESDLRATNRLAELEVEIDNLAADFLTGTFGPTLPRMLTDCEAEKVSLEWKLTALVATDRTVVAHPVVVGRYEQRSLRSARRSMRRR